MPTLTPQTTPCSDASAADHNLSAAMDDVTSTVTENGIFMLSDEERQPCEIWTRVMGYHRPMSSFNIGKKGEFHERRYFTEAAQNNSGKPNRGQLPC